MKAYLSCERKQEIVIPLIIPKIIEHQSFNCICSKCGVQTNSDLPLHLRANIQYGQNIVYLGYRNILTRLHFNLLKAIAKEGGISKPNAGGFIRKYNFTQPSSVNKAIKSLIDKEMLYSENGIYKVYDVYFSKWLERN